MENNSRRWATSVCRGQRHLYLVHKLQKLGCREWSACLVCEKKHSLTLSQLEFRNKQKFSLQWRADVEVEKGQEYAGGKADKFPSMLHEHLSLLSKLGSCVMLADQTAQAALPWPPEVQWKEGKPLVSLSHVMGTRPRRYLGVSSPHLPPFVPPRLPVVGCCDGDLGERDEKMGLQTSARALWQLGRVVVV